MDTLTQEELKDLEELNGSYLMVTKPNGEIESFKSETSPSVDDLIRMYGGVKNLKETIKRIKAKNISQDPK